MPVEELIATLKAYPPASEVRIVDRAAGWDDEVYMVTNDTYGIDSDTQVGICVN